MPVSIDARNSGLNVTFSRGTARNIPFVFPAGTLAGRTFTATLTGSGGFNESLGVVPIGDTLFVTIFVAQTTAAPEGPLSFVLTETTGVDQPVVIGTWRASTRPSQVTPPLSVTVSVDAATVQIGVPSGTEFPELASSDPAKMAITTALGVTTLDVERLAPESAWLTAQSAPVNNSTAFVDVTGLAVPVAANATYLVDAYIHYLTPIAADLNWQWTTPAGVSGGWGAVGLAQTAAAIQGSGRFNAMSTWASAQNYGGADAVRVALLIRGLLIVGGTAGTLQAQFTQLAATATNTTIEAGTWLRAERVD